MAIEFKEELFGSPNRLIMDPVHGGIPFFDHEATVIDHPLFQRLRHIVQNDITSLVFPGACHTRFIHSIGAMHIAGRFYKALVRSYLADKSRKKTDKIYVKHKNAIRYFYFCLRLAALLHDTGHFPFSHLIESSNRFKGLLSKDGLFETLWSNDSWKQIYNVIPSKLSHEHFSVRCAYVILNDVDKDSKFPVEPIDVLSLMETSQCSPSNDFINHAYDALGLFLRKEDDLEKLPKEHIAKNILSFLKIIISGEIDIDKMDYLLRDSFFSSCQYGVYNLDHLLSTFRIGFDLKTTPPWIGLAITKKGIGPLEDFVYSRFQLYHELYNHKTVVGFKWLLQIALDDLIDEEILSEIKEFLIDADKYVDFTDTYFWEKIRKYANKNPNSAASFLIKRRKLKHIFSAKDIEQFKINQLESDKKIKIITRSAPIKFSKIKKAYEEIRVLAKDPSTEKRKLDAIKDHTQFFNKFENVIITHVYEEPNLLNK